MDDSKSQPRDQQHGGETAAVTRSAANQTAANQTTANQTTANQTTDCTQYGQAAGSPGGRGGTSCYGGIQRVQPRTAPAATVSHDKDRGGK